MQKTTCLLTAHLFYNRSVAESHTPPREAPAAILRRASYGRSSSAEAQAGAGLEQRLREGASAIGRPAPRK
eukprot:8668150-Alexandrium_andersonii.AAC.1